MDNQDKKKQSLYDIAQDGLALDQLLFEFGGELTPELEGWMQEITTSLTTKADNLAFVFQRLDLNAEHADEMVDKWKAISKGCARIKDDIKKRMVPVLEMMGTDSVEGTDYKFSLRENPGRLEVNEEELLACYKMPVTTVVADKERIKNDLLEGRLVPGAKLIKTKTIQMRMKGPRR